MSWINEHKRVWRVAILVLLLVAIMGPWTFTDRINVPAEYPCSAPFIRLEGDFCGTPLSGIWIIGGFISMGVGLVTGATGFTDRGGGFLCVFLFIIVLLVLPFFSTLLLIVRGDRRRRQVFNVAAWGFAAGMGLLIGMFSYPKLFWMLWGIWLYIGLAVSALILEVLTLAAGRRPRQG